MGLFQRKQLEDPTAIENARLGEQVEVVQAVLRYYSAGTRLHFGAPTRCPHCGDYGFVQGVNKNQGAAYNHCFGCRADWVITLDALRAVEAMPVERAPVVHADPYARPFEVAAAMPGPVVYADPYAPPASEPAGLVPRGPAVAGVPSWTRATPQPTGPSETGPSETGSSDTVSAAPASSAPEGDASVPPAAPPAPEVVVLDGDTSRVAPPASSTPDAAGPADRPLRLLVVEDNPFDLAVLEEVVDLLGPTAVELIPAATRAEAERLAANTIHDAVLLDLNLPDSEGITTLLEFQHSGVSRAPVIILSGSNDAALIREARALGAVHFIQKDQLAELADAGEVGAQRFMRLLRTTLKRSASPAHGT